jgi:ferrous iron transport protein B
VDELVKIKEIPERLFTVKYDDHIEEALNRISTQLKENPLPSRFIALRALEGDKDFYHYLKDTRVIEKVKRDLIEHPRVAEDISITRYGTAAFIAERATYIIPLKDISESRGERIDKILLDKSWGPFLTILTFIAIFAVLLLLGNWIQGILMELTESVLSTVHLGGGLAGASIEAGLSGLMAGVSIALPYVFLFYLLLSLLEDVGLLSRFVVNLERFSKKFNLPGKAFIPLALGLGCTAPAIRGTRILDGKKEQFYASSFFTSVPCSSRIAIVMGVVGYFGGVLLAISVFVTLFASFLIWGFLAKKLTRIEKEPLLLELPPYRKPLIGNILAKSWIRMKDFVYIVMPFLIIGGMAYAILSGFGATKFIVEPLSPITAWLGLPSRTIIPIVFGFLQKDLTGAMLISVLGAKISLVLTPLQIYTFGVATTIQIPCIIAFGVLIKEFGVKRAVLLTATSMVYGLLFAGLAWRVVSIL